MNKNCQTIAAKAPRILLPDSFSGDPDWEGLCSFFAEMEGGVITSILPATPVGFTPDVDATNSIALPGFLDSHTHLDKAHSWERAPNWSGTFDEAIVNLSNDKEHWTVEDVYTRANYSLRCAYAHGTVALRSHVDTGLGWAERSYEALSQLREEWLGRVELQLVSLAWVADYATSNGEALADLPVHFGAVALGGMPVMNEDLDHQLDCLMQFAVERGVGLDLHVDENNRLDADCLEAVARAVLRNEFPHTVVCGHCCNLALKPLEKQLEVLSLVKEAGIQIVSLPMCNLYLQDRRMAGDAIQTPQWRGITLAHEFIERDIPFACASDNVRDAFYAYGDFDMLEVYRESLRIGHLDRKLAQSVTVATSAPAKLMDLETRGFGRLDTGSPASINLFHVNSLSQLLSRTQVKRSLLRDGALVSPELPSYVEMENWLKK
jgi:cytosine/creatinine deaminase